MEHTPDNCPYKKIIEELQQDVKEVKKMHYSLDKEFSSNSLLTKSQYETIITMLTNQGSDYKEIFKLVNDLEKRFVVNDYQTKKTTEAKDRLTWWLIAKIGTLVLVVGSILIGLFKQ